MEAGGGLAPIMWLSRRGMRFLLVFSGFFTVIYLFTAMETMVDKNMVHENSISHEFTMSPEYNYHFRYKRLENTSRYLHCNPHMKCDDNFQETLSAFDYLTLKRIERLAFMDIDTFCIIDVPNQIDLLYNQPMASYHFSEEMARIVAMKFLWKFPDQNITKIVAYLNRNISPKLAYFQNGCVLPGGFLIDCRGLFSISSHCTDSEERLELAKEALGVYKDNSEIFYNDEIIAVDPSGDLNLHTLVRLMMLPKNRILRNRDIYLAWSGDMNAKTQQALTAIGIGENRIINDNIVCGRHIYIPYTHICDGVTLESVQRLKDTILHEIRHVRARTGEDDWIVLFPGSYDTDAVYTALEQRYPHKIVKYTEDNSFIEMVNIASKGKIFIGPSENILSWFLYASPGSNVIEIHTNSSVIGNVLFELSIKTRMNYYGFFYPEDERGHVNIDLDELKGTVDMIMR